MPVRREAKMKNLALIALIMVLGLSGCASSGKSGFIIQEWTGFWKSPDAANLGSRLNRNGLSFGTDQCMA
jgi:hypothetical protein